jgi:predicted nuclease of predicted toxin-antitoxin system
MRFLLDESADFPLAAFLKQLGHDVTAIAHDYPQALSDLQVLAIAYQEQRILITNDHDFGELLFRRRLPHAGVILFRLGQEDLQTKQTWLLHVLRYHSESLQHFMVVTNQKIRIRRTSD